MSAGAHHAAPDDVVLFDLDGVLTRRDTFATLVVRRLRRSPARLVAALPVLPAMALSALVPQWRGPISRYLVRIALLGLTPDAGRRLGRDLAIEFASTPAWLRPEGIEAARRHLADGARVVVVTATERTLARTLLDQLGLESVELIASELAAAVGGARMHPHNYGARKRSSLRAAGVPQPWTVFYTDSWSDAPTMREVDRVVLVGPSESLRRRAGRSLIGEVDVLPPAIRRRS